jgi:nitrogen fixation/metabolism regulation signal transduction histidine kinase
MNTNLNVPDDLKGFHKPPFQHFVSDINNDQQETVTNIHQPIYQIIINRLSEANIGIGIISSNYMVLEQNHFLKNIFGKTEGKYCYEIYRKLSKPCNDCPLLKAISSCTARCIDVKASDGRSYKAFCGSLSNTDGIADKIFLIAEEITVPVKENPKTHSKTDVLTIAAHEIRQPLTTIKVSASTLLNYFEIIDDDEKKSYLKDIDNSANHLNNLVEFFMETSRFEKGLYLNKIHSQLSDILKAAVKEAAFKKNDLNISLEINEQLPEIKIDTYRIRQVIDNLIDNAIKYSPINTTISIKASRTGNNVVVSVADNGIGVPFKETNKIFNRYYRIKLGSQQKINGLGVGLYICRQFVEAHNGKIWVETEVGKGSIFRFSLPLDKD